jgi:hypothetical protein
MHKTAFQLVPQAFAALVGRHGLRLLPLVESEYQPQLSSQAISEKPSFFLAAASDAVDFFGLSATPEAAVRTALHTAVGLPTNRDSRLAASPNTPHKPNVLNTCFLVCDLMLSNSLVERFRISSLDTIFDALSSLNPHSDHLRREILNDQLALSLFGGPLTSAELRDIPLWSTEVPHWSPQPSYDFFLPNSAAEDQMERGFRESPTTFHDFFAP